MDISWDQSGDGPPSCVMAARAGSGTGLPVRVMRGGRCIAIRGVMVVAAVSCAGLLAGLAAVAPAAGSVSRGNGAAVVPGAQLWASTYNGPGNYIDAATAVAASPAGGAVFVTGSGWGLNSGPDYATVAYDAATGTQLWASRYDNSDDEATSLAVSQSGGTVFVTGQSSSLGGNFDYATVAYDAATGAQLWASRYNGPGGGADQATSVAVSPGGRAVFVTGKSVGTGGFFDYATVAYDAATGARLWVRRYDGPGHRKDVASAVAVSPGGGTVFVTGKSAGRASGLDYATVAYDAATGARRWVSRYNGTGHGAEARSVVAGPGGHAVYVTGESSSATGTGYATVSYSAATGAQRWVRVSRHNGSGGTSVAASPDGHAVYVTGGAGTGYRTIAYNAATGTRLWVREYYALNAGVSVAASPDGHAVYVTGTSVAAFGTVAYDAATGAQLWTATFDSSHAAALAVGPAGQVYVTGEHIAKSDDYATVAYQG
jgi:hypothetical protein